MVALAAIMEARPVAGTAPPADIYGQGREGVVLVAHGGYSTRASWAEEAQVLADAGFRVLVFETRGAIALHAGRETDCLYDAHCMGEDVVAAVGRLRSEGARSVAVIGGSAGGGAAAQASIDAPGLIDRLILLAPMSIDTPERITGNKLVVVARDDLGPGGRPRLTEIRQQYDQMPGPKKLLILEGSAHGQRIFGTNHQNALRLAIVQFLRAPATTGRAGGAQGQQSPATLGAYSVPITATPLFLELILGGTLSSESYLSAAVLLKRTLATPIGATVEFRAGLRLGLQRQ